MKKNQKICIFTEFYKEENEHQTKSVLWEVRQLWVSKEFPYNKTP